jgi:PAS domain S-box-containing protein
LLFDASGNATGFIGISRNITERKLAEETLKKSEERYKLISGTTTDFLFSCSRPAGGTYSIEWMAGAVERITGFTIDELRAMGCWRCLVDPEDYPVFDDSVINLPPGTSRTCILRIHAKDGTIRWLEVNTTNLPGTLSSLPEQVFGGCRDITGRKRAEEALREANRKLNLLSGITRHDISNQLTVLQGYILMFEKKQPDPSFSVYFQKMNRSVDRISAMIQLTKEYEEIGVNTPVWQDIRTFVDEGGNNSALGDIRLLNDVPAGSEVFADPLITRVCYNLVDNAVRYGGKITTIRFSVEDGDGDHVIVCEDDGAGIPHEEKEKIFERGFGKNTGLGLFLSREILAITGITIKETGGPGKGARFEMKVPKGMYR